MKSAVSTLIHTSIVLLVITSGVAREAMAGSDPEVPAALGLVTTSEPARLDAQDAAATASSFVYFSGQRIATQAENLVLTLEDGSLALGPESAAVVTGSPGAYRMAFEQGTMHVHFGASADFEIVAGDVLLRRSSEAADTEVEASLRRDASGAFEVASQRGMLETSGGTLVAQGDEPLRLVVDPSASLADVAAGGETSLLMRAVYAGGGLAVFGGVAGLGVALSDKKDDDGPASPTM